MSISEKLKELKDRVSDGSIFPYEPRRRKAKRRIYLYKQAVKDLNDPSSAFGVLNLQPQLANVLEIWVTGGRVWTDANRKPRFLKPIYPPSPDVWEMMMIEPRAQVRIFSLFAEPDTIFVSHMRTRAFLGKKGSQNWIDAKQYCWSTFINLFEVNPFKSPSIHDYVTENCDDFAC